MISETYTCIHCSKQYIWEITNNKLCIYDLILLHVHVETCMHTVSWIICAFAFKPRYGKTKSEVNVYICLIFMEMIRKNWHFFNTLLQAVIVETPQGIQYEGRRLDASKVKPCPCDVLTLCQCEYFCSSLILCCLWELKPQNTLCLTVTCYNDRCFFHHQGDGGMVSMTAECAASLYDYLHVYHSFLERCLLLILSWFNSLHQLQTCDLCHIPVPCFEWFMIDYGEIKKGSNHQ